MATILDMDEELLKEGRKINKISSFKCFSGGIIAPGNDKVILNLFVFDPKNEPQKKINEVIIDFSLSEALKLKRELQEILNEIIKK